jgi:hypothetical protein
MQIRYRRSETQTSEEAAGKLVIASSDPTICRLRETDVIGGTGPRPRYSAPDSVGSSAVEDRAIGGLRRPLAAVLDVGRER